MGGAGLAVAACPAVARAGTRGGHGPRNTGSGRLVRSTGDSFPTDLSEKWRVSSGQLSHTQFQDQKLLIFARWPGHWAATVVSP